MLEYRDEYPKLPLVIIHLLDDMVKTKNQVMKDTIHELVAIIVTERNVDDFVEEDLLENEGTLVKSRLARGKAKFLGIVDKAYLMTVVKHAKRPNMYILVISGAEVETKTLNEEVEELEENEITIPIEDENDREKAEELAEKLEECAITEFKVDEDGEDELSITYTNANKDKVEEILEECGVELSDEEDEFDEDGDIKDNITNYIKLKPSSKATKTILQKYLDLCTDKNKSKYSYYENDKNGGFIFYLHSDVDVDETIEDILGMDNKCIIKREKVGGKVGVRANNRTGAYDEDEPLEEGGEETFSAFLYFKSENPKHKKVPVFQKIYHLDKNGNIVYDGPYGEDKAKLAKYYGVKVDELVNVLEYEITNESVDKVDELCSKLVKSGAKILGMYFWSANEMDKCPSMIKILKNKYKVKSEHITF